MTFRSVLEVCFWISAIGSAFSYLAYPVLLRLVPRRGVETAPLTELPRISVIIAARNEIRRIDTKLRRTLELDYPRELLEIIVASDASDDGTDDVVRAHEGSGVRLSRAETRGGKEAAQARAIAASTGEILVFTDSATRLDAGALRRVAHILSDASVGAVSSEDRLENPERSGEGAYVRYEMWLRRLESERAGLVGLSGSFFAVRRAVADQWPVDVPSDITAALRTASLGLRAITDPELVGYYSDLSNPAHEYERKVRTVVRGMTAVARMPGLLNPLRHGLYAFQLWGHKILRWATPAFLILLWITSGLLSVHGALFAILFGAQTACYLAATLVWLRPGLKRFAPLRLLFYLVQVHVALLHAGFRYLRGDRIVVWNPSVR